MLKITNINNIFKNNNASIFRYNKHKLNSFLSFQLIKFSQQSFTSMSSSTPIIKDYVSRKDHMISGFFKDGSARFVMTDISQTLQDAQSRFEIFTKEKLEQLGIAYNTSLIMNSFLNGEERVKLICQYIRQINEEDPQMTTIYSESIGSGEVRGFFEEGKIESDQVDTEQNSFLKISKILYNQPTEVYGIIKLINSGQLTEDDIYKYFEESEQIRTHVFFHHELSNKNFISQGFILQKMPDCNLEELEKIFYRIINNKNFIEINKNGLFLNSFQKIFEELGIEIEGLRRTPIQFFCRCSKSQFMNVLIHLDKKELEDMKTRDHRVITCKNCNTDYSITDEDFANLIK